MISEALLMARVKMARVKSMSSWLGVQYVNAGEFPQGMLQPSEVRQALQPYLERAKEAETR